MKFYIDTSVFGGLFDKEFARDTEMLFEYIRKEEIKIMYSRVLERELRKAPDNVRATISQVKNLEYIRLDKDIVNLAETYIKEGALKEKSANDAYHIAIATARRADVIVSWNFKHMVNFLKIRQYNTINLREGYGIVNIQTPTDIIGGKL